MEADEEDEGDKEKNGNVEDVAKRSCCCTQSELMGGDRKVAMLPSGASHVIGQGQPPMATVVLDVKKGPTAAPLATPPMRVKLRGPWNWMLNDCGVDDNAALHIADAAADDDDAGASDGTVKLLPREDARE